MFSAIISDFASWFSGLIVKAVFGLVILVVCGLGLGFATGKLQPEDLRPENVHNVLNSIQGRVNQMKGLASELSNVDFAGVVSNLRERQEALEELAEDANPYEDIPIGRLQDLAQEAQDDLGYDESDLFRDYCEEDDVEAGMY